MLLYKNKVAIILCSYNPNLDYFSKQIESIANQNHTNFHLYIFDDGSSQQIYSKMKSIVCDFKLSFTFNKRDNKEGCCMNFLKSLQEINGYDYYCFADQDDIWFKDKLSRGLKYLINCDLYCSSTVLINKNDREIGINNINVKPSFKHSLVQSIAGGNTYIFNGEIKAIISNIRDLPYFSHDWFIYQLAAGAGYKIFYDKSPSVYYRLHGKNLTGTSNTILSKLQRLRMLMRGDFLNWTNRNIECLNGHKEILTKNNKNILDFFSKKRSHNLLSRLSLFHSYKFRRSTLAQNITFYIALILKKI
jgi:glycosyltransferase involved in cell wall biosynthesis